ncbi:MAG: TetR/AcrR family transcriptional regulator [Alphaproteobacteria bacterium]|nr:TetR/AcrR family transcriptional regulator [Alphaproteobacteria bacterium]
MPPRRRGTPKDPERAREAILDAALKRFSRKGYRGTRVADVAADAGYSEALVYFHFKSKSELFREVVNNIDRETKWFTDDPTADELVQQMHDGELQYHRDARWRALDRIWAEALAGEKDLLDLLKPQLEGTLTNLDALLARYDRIDHPRRATLARFIMAVSYGSRVMRRYDPGAVSPEEAADVLAFATKVALDALDGGGPPLDGVALPEA